MSTAETTFQYDSGPPVESGRLATWLFLAAESLFFGGLLSAWFVLRAQAQDTTGQCAGTAGGRAPDPGAVRRVQHDVKPGRPGDVHPAAPLLQTTQYRPAKLPREPGQRSVRIAVGRLDDDATEGSADTLEQRTDAITDRQIVDQLTDRAQLAREDTIREGRLCQQLEGIVRGHELHDALAVARARVAPGVGVRAALRQLRGDVALEARSAEHEETIGFHEKPLTGRR